MFEDKDIDNKNENFELDLSHSVYDATKPSVYNANQNRRTVNKPLPRYEEKSKFNWKVLVKWVIVAVVLIFVIDFAKSLIPGSISLDHVINMETEEVEKELGITLARNCSMNTQINQYSRDGEVTVDGDGEIGVVYIDGKHMGLHVDDKKYSMFGIKLGDTEAEAEKNMTYQYEDSAIVINDWAQGISTSIFYYTYEKDDCLVVIYNDSTNRVVAMTYFNDMDKVTEGLSGF